MGKHRGGIDSEKAVRCAVQTFGSDAELLSKVMATIRLTAFEGSSN